MKTRRKRSEDTGGDCIKDEKLCEGYVVNATGRIVGEARRYDPYAHYGEVKFYEIDSFGFVEGYLRDNWTVMSKDDLLNDDKLRKELEKAEYEQWVRHNVSELKERWDNYACKYYDDFEKFCKRRYAKLTD